MPDIKIEIKNKIATADSAIYVVCDNSNYFVDFVFDDEWNQYQTKTARFIWSKGHKDEVFNGSRVKMPRVKDTLSCSIGVYAGNLCTSTSACVTCIPSVLGTDGSPAAPEPDVYAQIMELLNNMGGGNGEPGNDGLTPYIGENGNWFIGEEDTGVKAAGEDGEPGKPGITPHIGDNGNWWIGETDTGICAEGYVKQLQPLNFKKARYNSDTLSDMGSFDGTEAKEVTIPVGFARKTSGYIYQIEGPVVLDGDFSPNEYKSEKYSFKNGYAFGMERNGKRHVYAFDMFSNKQYHFLFDSAWAFGLYEVTTAPLVSEASGGGDAPSGGGGTWEKVGEIITTEEVSSIEMSVGAEYKEIYIQAEAKSTVGGKLQTIDVANTNKLVQNTTFFPSNNVGRVVVHLKLADGFAFGEFSCVTANADGNYATYGAASHRTALIKSKELTNGFERVKFAVADDTYQVGARLIVWGCK